MSHDGGVDLDWLYSVIHQAVQAIPKPKDGRDYDPEVLEAAVQRAVDAMPKPKDGQDGKDGKRGPAPPAATVRLLIQQAVDALPKAEPGERGARGPKGERGPKGDTGARGPIPDHEWDGTRLRFQEADGDWGKWVDLKGPPGQNGFGGVVVQQPSPGGGGYSYFPSGWT